MLALPPFSPRSLRIAVAFLAGVTVGEGWPLETLFTKRPLPWLVHWGAGTLPAWLLAGAVCALYVVHTVRSSAIIRAWWLRWHWLRLLAVPMALVTGTFEEAFFRKFVMDYVARHYAYPGWTVALEILASAVLFGLVHAIWGLAGGSLLGAGYAMIYTSLLGAGMAIVYLLGGRSLLPCVAAHVAINLLCEPWMILSAASGSWTKRR